MKIVNTFHQPSTVIASLKCALSSDSQLAHLVVAKVSRIEVSSIQPEGLKHECSLEIWGRVIAMRAVAAEDPVASNILVLTDHPDPRLILLTYATRNGEAYLDCTYHCALHDRVARHAEFFTDIAVAPSRDLAVVSCYVGKLKVIQFSEGEVKSEFDVILPEHNVYALSILHSDVENIYPLAIVHMDHMQRVQLIARDLDVASQDLSFTLSPTLPNSLLPANTFPDIDTPLMLVPVPSFAIRSEEEEDNWGQCLGGVLVLGGRKILFYEVASVERQKRQKNKDNRQSKRKSSGNEQQAEVARQKDKEREAKKVKPRMSVKWPWSEVTAWCPADDEMRRFFLGDMYGRLAMLVLGERAELILIPLGETSPPTTMSYLSNQILYIGSHMGNPQVVQVHATAQTAIDEETLPIPADISTVSSKELADDNEDVEMEDAGVDNRSNKGKIVKTRGSFVEILESYPNIAPIVDAMLVDTDGSGQPQIVTCSGGRNTGSLNIVRTGADFHELAVLNGIPNALNVWPIRPNYDSPTHSHLMVSTLRESLLFRFDSPATVTRLNPEVAGLTLDKPTIALANIRKRVVKGGKSTYPDSSCIVQVTAGAVTLVEYDPQLEIFHRVGPYWTPGTQDPTWMGRRIVAASINPSQIVVALSGGAVVLLNLYDDGHLSFVQHREFGGSEVSAISCATFASSKNYSMCIAVAFWNSNVIRLLALDPTIRLQDLGDPQKYPVLPSLPRSILLHNFGTASRSKEIDYQPYVVAGLADGSIACFSIKGNELKDMKLFPLGTAPVSLAACDVDGKRAVFANGSQSSVLYWDKQRLRQSAVMVKNVAAGASLTTAAFPSCQILATPSSILIGQIRGVDKMQIRSIPLGFDNPKRIACSAEYRVFGVACSRPTPSRIGDGVTIRSSFVLFDGTSFDRLSEYVCDPDEEVSAILSVKQGKHFLVGTVRHQVGEIEPSAGRLLLFSMQAGDGTTRGERGRSLDLKLLTSCNAEGCVYALVEVDGAIGAAVNTSVDLYRIIVNEADEASTQIESSVLLTRVSRWNHNYFVTSLAARGDNLIAGDAISSVSIVKVKGNDLETVARNYGPLWPIAVAGGRDQGVIGANCDCNLFTLSISQQKLLQLDGNFHLGDVVTTLIPGRLSTQDEHEARIFEPEHLFFTSSGRIGVIHHVNSQVAMLLTQLQNNMSDATSGPGDVVHSKWRTPTNSRGRTDADSQAIGFLDGDFLEQFLTYTDPNELLTGVKLIEKPREEIEAILEKLQSLH